MIKDKFGNSEDKSIEIYLSELGWCEFSYYLLFYFFILFNKNFNEKFDKFFWCIDVKVFKVW